MDELGLFQGHLAHAYGLGGAVHGRGRCGRQLAAMADLTMELWGARRWLCGQGGVGAPSLCEGRG